MGTLSMGKASFDVLLRPSLVGPRRVAAAMTRRLLEDARERHVLRGSYQARTASGGGNDGFVSVIFVEALTDVLQAVRASRRARDFIQTVQDDAAASRIATSRRKRLIQKLRCIAHCIGRIHALHARVRATRNAGQAADSAWRELQESLVTPSVSLGLASFALCSKGVKSFGIVSKGIRSFGLGSQALKSMGLGSVALQRNMPDASQNNDQSVTLGGGNVVAALRSVRKDLSKRGASVPRAPGALLKCLKPSKKAIVPAPPARGSDDSASSRPSTPAQQRRRSKRSTSVA